MSEWKEIAFGELLSETVRNGIYKKKEFHGRGTSIVNMGELFSYPRLKDIEMKKVELSNYEKEKCFT
jgi:type I restriction enzyme, S subunit